ncbi:MAG: VOC family protein, partial [Flavobacteriaceae bacterium]
MDHNMVGWFEIPVTDMQRAKKFYEKVFGIAISIH